MADVSLPVTPGVGTNVDGRTEDVNGDFRQVVVLGDPSVGLGVCQVDPLLGLSVNPKALLPGTQPVAQKAADLIQSVTGVAGALVTATLPAVASQFHYITLIEIVKYFTAANAASATPLVATTTNLPGSLAYTFGQPLGTIGTIDKMVHNPNSPIKSSVANTPTTIVCPATVGIIWRINVYYYAAV